MQDFHLDRFKEFNEKGVAAYKAGEWKDARYNLMRAAEHLFKLAEGTPAGKIRDQRKEQAAKLLEKAKKIDPEKPPSKPGARTETSTRTTDTEEEKKQFKKVERPKVKFADIAGLEDVKEEVRLKLL